jgi:Kef-type K+ transport system membrane component KefB
LHLPAVLGELVGGIVIGPTLFGALAPSSYVALFPSSGPVSMARDALIRVGLLCFLFVAGLEVNLGQMRKLGWTIAWTSLLGIAFPFATGFALVLAFPRHFGPQAAAHGVLYPLFLGTAMSISALPVIARILMDLSLTRTRLGMVVMAAATIDDLIGWSLFAVILSKVSPIGIEGERSLSGTLVQILLLFGLILTVGRWTGQKVLRWAKSRPTWPSGFMSVAAIAVLLTAALAEAIGIHAVLGAFLVGVALAQNNGKRDEAHEAIYQLAVSCFAPLYFVSIGLQADFARNFDPALVLLVLAVACIGKIGGVGLGAWLSKLSVRESLAVGFGMNARGAMGMILASLALEHGLIDQRMFVALIAMAFVTSILSGPIMHRLIARRETVGASTLSEAEAVAGLGG